MAIPQRVERARAVRHWWTSGDHQPDAVVGLALSGGGIRSATFSLGLIQALARSKRGALARIDVLSTVSGGGYIGTFLRSLYLPQIARGIGADLPFDEATQGYLLDPLAITEQAEFAARVLASGPDQKDIEPRRRNPIWWLREHSRYLAPNGPTDYGYAVAYLSRNWIAMLFIFALAVAAAMSVVTVAEALLARLAPGAWTRWAWPTIGAAPTPLPACPAAACDVPVLQRTVPISPVFLLAALPLTASATLSIGYWLSQAMSANEPKPARQRGNLVSGIGLAGVGAASVILFWALLVWAGSEPLISPMPLALAAGVSLTLAAIATVLVAARPNWRATLLTAELRRRLTKWLALSNLVLLGVLVVAVVDSAGAGLAYLATAPGHGWRWPAIAALAPAAAFLFKKLPEFGERAGAGGVVSRLGRLLPALALIAGAALYGSIAIAADAVLHHAAWPERAGVLPVQGSTLALTVATVWILAAIVGRATGLINLSSLHLLYATRLTRAYLGASNLERLRKAADPAPGGEITDNDAADYIRPCIYGLTDLPAPIHIINITINETIDPHSQLVARDRKGGLLSVEPAGIRTGRHDEHIPAAGMSHRADRVMATTELTRWADIGKREVAEDISLGQWCAISGAAASSGMGRLTKLGYALALTFANVRLGYWWWAPNVCEDYPKPSKAYQRFGRWFGTFVYLSNELTARYSRGYQRKYLTDGGHFEDSGAYALIRRRVPLILVSDNGSDPGYAFADLQSLVRTVRLDLGAETSILGGDELTAALATLGCTDHGLFVDPASRPDWGADFKPASRREAVLVLRVTFPKDLASPGCIMLWIKPRLLPHLPPDLAGYAADNSTFPQQTTANQFFDEAQWESYRKLGDLMMTDLLEACPTLLS